MSTSNIFSNVFIYGNCTVAGTFTSLGGSAVSQWTTSGSLIYYSTGNVGIGTAAPVSTFEVTGTGFPGTALTRTAAGDNYGVGIQYSLISNTGSFRGYYARAFGGSLGTIATTNQNQANGYFGIDVANAGLFASDTYGYAGVQFYVAPTISVFNTRVGIGTTNPGSLLTVSGGGSFGSGYNAFTAPTGGLIVQGNVGIGTSNPGVNALQVSGNVVTSGFTSNATNTVFNFDTLTVPFLNATQVGIGTTNPGSALQVVGTVTATTFSGAGTSLTVQQLGTGAVMNVATSTGSSALFVSSTGQVGVGTNSQFANGFGSGLMVNSGTINGSNAFNMVFLSNATTVNYTQVGQIGFGIGGDMPSFSIQSQAVNRDNGAGPYYDYGAQSDLRFLYKTFNTWPAGGVNEAMRIKGTNGNVGIGTTSPAAVLDVVDQNNAGIALRQYNSADGVVIRCYRALGTIASPTVVIADSCIAGLRAFAYNGTAFSSVSAGINLNAAETFTATAQGSYIQFLTTASTTTVYSEKMRILGNGNVGIGTTAPATILDVAGVISTNGLPLPYCIASGTGTFGTSYATTPAHGGSYFWYDRSSPIVIPQGANITIEIWGQSGYNQQGIAIDPYNSSTSQFNIQNTSQGGINEINATYYGTSITAVATDNTTQNPPWTMFSMLQNTTIAYYNWQQTIKFFNPPTPSGNNKVVCGTVNGSGLHSAGNCAQFTGSIGFYSSTIAYTVTGFRILLVTTSTTTFSSTYSYRVYVS